MQPVILQLTNIKKVFQRRVIFSGINLSLQDTQVVAVTGRNGSGKSTLLKIIAGLLSPTMGSVELTIKGKQISANERFAYLGFVAPYLQLYDEFTAWENLELFCKIRGAHIHETELRDLLELVGLAQRKHDLVRTFSSGMKQRLKYTFALLHKPSILILDEPRSNLDAEGIEAVYGILNEYRKQSIVIVATNDKEDIGYCDQVLDLNSVSERGMP